ncbi:MAG: AmmeMemoRadiSam system protein A, partial [Anaerolineae bacterium]|nr:AmmeMemoRadiSam system protein A [Anaerolineae bacterium]
IVPILMGHDDEETVQALASALQAVLHNDRRRVVVIASSDLSHYPQYDDALAADGATLGAIETFDPARVRETIMKTMLRGIPNLVTCACSEGPILVVMHVARGLGADTATVLGYANSADTGGERSQVVGYGTVMFWRYEPPAPTEAQRAELLKLARAAIAEHLKTGATPAYETTDPLLNRRAGVFVTLKQRGQLRGCIGHTRADLPLYQAVQHMAIAAATSDPRFPPLKLEELDDISIEISILSPMRRVTDLEQIEVGTHGLVIFKEGRQGLLLPQVPVEQGWGREEYLDNLCLKAGLSPNCWTDQPTLYSFTAIVFGE